MQVSSAPKAAALDPARLCRAVEDTIGRVIRGKRQLIRRLFIALVARGHVLIEDVPGVGKTTLARALAVAVGASFRRIQFTSDLLPSDILGVSVYDEKTRAFEFKPGPIFANIVLADEINRTTPRTQSALLEALNEGQVTVDTETHLLSPPFMVVATQNPIEHYGTYPLPESQMDRFMLRLEVGYPSPEEERAVVAGRGAEGALEALESVLSPQEVLELQQRAAQVKVDDALLDYSMAVVGKTRQAKEIALGVSPRGAIAWFRAAQASALLAGRDHCIPDDFKELALPCLAHRVVLDGRHEHFGQDRSVTEQVLAQILDSVDVPI